MLLAIVIFLRLIVGDARSEETGVAFWRPLAERGNAAAQTSLGLLYQTGKDGAVQDYTEAVKWYRLAATQGYRPAFFHLGEMYVDGLGVPKDYVRAHMWWNLAAAAGDAGSGALRDAYADKMMTP